MKLDECKEVILSVIAEMDGEIPLLATEQTALHLSQCETCRIEVERQEIAVNVFLKQERRALEADLWLKIEKRIQDTQISEPIQTRYFFLLLVVILIAYKLLEMLPVRDLGFLFKLMPLTLITVLFYLFKENPFKINPELKLEG